MGVVKKCNECGKTKPLTDYYKSNQNADGRYCYCKTCHKERVMKWQQNNRHLMAGYYKTYEQTPKRIEATRKRSKKRYKLLKDDPNFKEKRREYARDFYARHKERLLAEMKERIANDPKLQELRRKAGRERYKRIRASQGFKVNNYKRKKP